MSTLGHNTSSLCASRTHGAEGRARLSQDIWLDCSHRGKPHRTTSRSAFQTHRHRPRTFGAFIGVATGSVFTASLKGEGAIGLDSLNGVLGRDCFTCSQSEVTGKSKATIKTLTLDKATHHLLLQTDSRMAAWAPWVPHLPPFPQHPCPLPTAGPRDLLASCS